MLQNRSVGVDSATGPLLERDHELAVLGRLLDDARDLGHGALAVVEGPAGIGKTRLLEGLRNRAEERGFRTLAARASELDREFPFGVVRQLFEPLLNAAAEEERSTLLRGAAALSAPLLLGSEPPGLPGSDDRSLVLFHSLYWLAANLAELAPLLLVADDLHWADPNSMHFLQFIQPRLRELPILVALGTRPGEAGVDRGLIDVLATDALTHVLRPPPLSVDAVQVLVWDTLGQDAEPVFCRACHEATGGNPLLVRELLRELDEDHVPPNGASAALVRQLAPSTVARSVLLRLARLGESASRLAQAVAVLGDGTSLRRACALAGVAEEQAEVLTLRLTEAGIFAPGRPLGFAHPILRAAVYRELDPGERTLAHRRAGELLAAEGSGADAIAMHLLATEPRNDPSVVDVLREAARVALTHGALDTAVACLARALEEPPVPGQRAQIILELAAAELRSGDPARANEHFREGIHTAREPRLRARFAWDHALALQALGRHEEALRARETAAEDVRDEDPELAYSLEASLLASARLELPRIACARSRLEQFLGQPSLPARAEQRMRVTQAQVNAFAPESDISAAPLADVAAQAISSGHLIDGGIGVTTPFFSAVELLALADRGAEARRPLDQLVDEAQRLGSAPAFVFGNGWRCLVVARVDSLADAEADVRSCAELALAQGWFRLSPLILGYGLEVLIERGQLKDAEDLLERSGIVPEIDEQSLLYHPVIHARARLAAARGNLAAARLELRRLRGARWRWNTHPTLVPPILISPDLVGPEDRESAIEDAEGMLRDAHVWGTARAIGMALRTKALLAGVGERGELLTEAVNALENSVARLELARALTDLGTTMRVANRRAAAREPLRRALDIADSHGATALANRVRHELRAAGARARRPRTSGVESLTASERRIATMAAEGRSNPEIAQALFVTKKTVEAHLGNVYRKLDIASRVELSRVLEVGIDGA